MGWKTKVGGGEDQGLYLDGGGGASWVGRGLGRWHLHQSPTKCSPGTADLVEILGTTDDHGLPSAAHPKSFGEDRTQVSTSDTDDPGLDSVVHGIGQWSEQVENGPPSEFSSYRRYMFHAQMKDGPVEKGIVGRFIHLRNRFGPDIL